MTPLRLLPLLVLAACIDNGPGFRCQGDTSCGAGGRCEGVGWCSFADPSCASSGRRFGELSGDGLGGQCVAGAGGPDAPLGEGDGPGPPRPDAPGAADGAVTGCLTQIAAGARHTCVVTTAGAVRCFGDNAGADLGDGTYVPRSSPVDVLGLPEAAERVTVGGFHTCALTVGKRVLCWGANGYGQIGDGSQSDATAPFEVASLAGARAVAAGYLETCAIAGDGTVWCWGSNDRGQLGDPSKVDHDQPFQVPGIQGATAIAFGDDHGCALTPAGVLCWGDNSAGQLGDGTHEPRAAPVRAKIDGAEEIAAGFSHTCARKGDGSVWCWGANGNKELGVGMEIDDSPTPLEVTTVPAAANLAAFSSDTCARTAGGELYCWGNDASGQLGDGSPTYDRPPQKAPVGDVVEVAVGYQHVCIRHSDGGVGCWGNDQQGQLGDGTVVASSAPRAVTNLADAVGLAGGGAHICAARAGGAIACWGNNESGQLGDNSNVPRTLPTPVFMWNGTLGLAGGERHTCAIDTLHELWCWGSNQQGDLGDGTVTPEEKNRPTPVASLTAVAQVAAGSAHTCARTDTGALYCWGANDDGQLGIGGNAEQHAPQPVGLTGVVEVAAGRAHTCARTADKLYCWGNNDDGQLGSDLPTPQPLPQEVKGVTGALQVVVGYGHTCARTAAAVYCWGRGYEGQLGDGGGATSSTPVMAYRLQASAIAANMLTTCAIVAGSGTVSCWGANDRGQVGDGTFDNQLVPTPVKGLGGSVAEIALGDQTACARTSAGAVSCWGTNEDGELGIGSKLIRLAPTAALVTCP